MPFSVCCVDYVIIIMKLDEDSFRKLVYLLPTCSRLRFFAMPFPFPFVTKSIDVVVCSKFSSSENVVGGYSMNELLLYCHR